MRISFSFIALFALATPLMAQDHTPVVHAETLKWINPPFMAPGAYLAVVHGDPQKEGEFTIRIKSPRGGIAPPHTHPGDENITVISGSFHVGMGPDLDKAKGDVIRVGEYAFMPKGMQHYGWYTEDSVIQIHGFGPFRIDYVHPEDDPRSKRTERQ